ncbi:MAG: hypothetical protein HN838_02025, partial [Rhodospirillaceae bacterium]|nr:hypothetical protein [Rhodospirillaceae bacterium]
FCCVVIGWGFFRAENFADAANILSAMFGGNGQTPASQNIGILIERKRHAAWLLALLALVWLAPNTYQLFARHKPALVPPNLRAEIGQDGNGDDPILPLVGIKKARPSALFGEALEFIRIRFSLIALVLTIWAFIMLGAIFFNPGQIPNTFIYSIF